MSTREDDDAQAGPGIPGRSGPSPGLGSREDGNPADCVLDPGERSAQLPVEPLPESAPSLRNVTTPATETERRHLPQVPAAGAPSPPAERHSQFEGRPLRESLLLALLPQRTTLHEVGDLARRLSVLAPGLGDASAVVRQLALSFGVALVVVLLGTMAFAAGTMRVVLGVLAGTVGTTLAVFGALRLVSRLGRRRVAHELPGSALIWVGGVVFVVVAATVALTWGVSEATRPLAGTRARVTTRPSASAAASARIRTGHADAQVQRGARVNLGRGVLYVPPGFSAPDGQFDLFIHYHGNPELVEASVTAAGLGALVFVINYGEGSDKYSKPLQNPSAFDQLLGSVETAAETRLGLAGARVRRIALAAWSAGYGAIYHILSSRSRLDRVDAVLLMDAMHASFSPGSKTEVYLPHLKPFLDFARRAVEGDKLMVVTHSGVETEGYASTTQTANALLAALGIERRPLIPPLSPPPPLQIRAAIWAFPDGERRWLSVTTEAKRGNFSLLGCSGDGKGDHIAHLAQMSQTVLGPLVARWR